MSIPVAFWPLLGNSLWGTMKGRQSESLGPAVSSLACRAKVQGCEVNLEAVLESEALTEKKLIAPEPYKQQQRRKADTRVLC